MLSSSQLQTKLVSLVEKAGGSGAIPPLHAYSGDCHEKLTRQSIDDAVLLFSRFLGMNGSGGDVDIYRVMQAYLLDPVMKLRFNELLLEWRSSS